VFVKLCGLRTEADVATAADVGADAVGFVFGPSPRQVDIETARRLVAAVPQPILAVGVFGNVPIEQILHCVRASGVAVVQLHGNYNRSDFDAVAKLPVRLWRATTLTPETDVRVGSYGEEVLLLDSPVAGSGRRWDLAALAGGRPQGQWLLAGGLAPGNVAQAISEADPWGVDVSSGIESRRGVKDHGLMREFVSAVRAALT